MSKEFSKQHNQTVWEQFWEKQNINQVYSNSERIVEHLQKTVDLDGKLVMEVGAGSGRDGFKLADCGAIILFLDYASSSLKTIDELSKKLNKKVLLIRGDAFNMPFKENVLDIVYHQGLLEHFTNPKCIVDENYRVLKNGGLVCADVPQRYHIYTVVKHILIWLNKWFAGWETEFSIGQLKKLIKSAGFEIHHVYGDWMYPSFFYRALRESLKKVGLTLPLYPKHGALYKYRKKMSQFFKQKKIAFYTFMDIGVIGKKGCAHIEKS